MSLPVSRLRVGKRVGEVSAGTAEPNRPKRYFLSNDIMLGSKNWQGLGASLMGLWLLRDWLSTGQLVVSKCGVFGLLVFLGFWLVVCRVSLNNKL